MVIINKKFDSLSFTDKHTMLLGAFTLVATRIEHVIELALTGLIGSNQRYGGATVRWISVQQQIPLINKIIEDQYGGESEIFSGMKEALSNAQKALDNRNKYVHALHHYRDNDEDSFSILLRRSGLEATPENIDLEQMQKDLESASDCMHDLAGTMIVHSLPFPPTSPDKSSELSLPANHIKDHN